MTQQWTRIDLLDRTTWPQDDQKVEVRAQTTEDVMPARYEAGSRTFQLDEDEIERVGHEFVQFSITEVTEWRAIPDVK